MCIDYTLEYLFHLACRARISVHVNNVQGRVALVVDTGNVSTTLKERERESVNIISSQLHIILYLIESMVRDTTVLSHYMNPKHATHSMCVLLNNTAAGINISSLSSVSHLQCITTVMFTVRRQNIRFDNFKLT